MSSNYEAKLRRVIDYIHSHLEEELNMDRLAEVACLSPFHWHRIYRGVFGESIVVTVKRIRLHRAAGYLAHTDWPIDKIVEKTGYKSSQSFNRIFKAEYGLPPAQYRKQGSHTQFQLYKVEEIEAMYDVSFKKIPDIKLVTIKHQGSYMEIGNAFGKLYAWMGARNLFSPSTRAIGIYYDDPDSIAEAELNSRAGVTCDQAVSIESPFEEVTVEGGDYAVLNYKGPYSDMKSAYHWFYGDWLMKSGKQAADKPVFEEYLNNPRDTAPQDLLTDIYLPLA